MPLKTSVQLNSPILQPGLLRQALAKVVAEATADLEREVKEQMRAPKHGRTYRRGRITRAADARASRLASRSTRGLRTFKNAKGKTRAIVGYRLHRASAPGEAPAIDSKELIGSIRKRASGLRGTVSASAPHAERLEFKMNRAVFGPALEKIKPGFLRKVDETVGRMCRG